MKIFDVQSNEQSSQLPEVDRPVVEERRNQVTRAVTNALFLQQRLGVMLTPEAEMPVQPQPEAVPQPYVEPSTAEMTPSELSAIENDRYLDAIAEENHIAEARK